MDPVEGACPQGPPTDPLCCLESVGGSQGGLLLLSDPGEALILGGALGLEISEETSRALLAADEEQI